MPNRAKRYESPLLCEDRCQMGAVQLVDGKASVDIDWCFGCGPCVSTCTTDSMTLVRKPESDQPDVPQDIITASIELGRARGKFSLANLLILYLLLCMPIIGLLDFMEISKT